MLCKNDELIISASLRQRVVSWYHHHLQHPGHSCLEKTMRSVMYWKGMHNTIQKYIKSCRSCQINKRHSLKYGHVPPKLVITTPWRALCVDLVGPYLSPETCNLPVLEMALPFPVTVPISSNVLLRGPFLKIFYFVQSPNWQSAITGTGCDSFCPISGTGLCHFQCGCSLGPVPELDSMPVVPFPVPGSASSGTVVHRAPYRNWMLCAWSHFRYRALPVLVRLFIGSYTGTGLYARAYVP